MSVEQDLDTLCDNVSALRSSVAVLETRLDALGKDSHKQSGSVMTVLTDTLPGLSTKLDVLAVKIDNLISGKISDLEKKQAALEQEHKDLSKIVWRIGLAASGVTSLGTLGMGAHEILTFLGFAGG